MSTSWFKLQPRLKSFYILFRLVNFCDHLARLPVIIFYYLIFIIGFDFPQNLDGFHDSFRLLILGEAYVWPENSNIPPEVLASNQEPPPFCSTTLPLSPTSSTHSYHELTDGRQHFSDHCYVGLTSQTP